MATSTSWSQDVITCDLCDKAAQQFCNSCQVSFCETCIQFCNSCQVNLCETCIKKHRDEFKSLPHDIVPFLDRKIQVVFPECQEGDSSQIRPNKSHFDFKLYISKS